MKKNSDLEFSSGGVCRLLGIAREALREWQVRGYVVPSRFVPWGSREKAMFSLREVYLVETFRRLLAFGLSRDQASRVIAHMRSKHAPPITAWQDSTNSLDQEDESRSVIYLADGIPVGMVSISDDGDYGLEFKKGELTVLSGGRLRRLTDLRNRKGKPVMSRPPAWDTILVFDVAKVRQFVNERVS
ncbi:MAG: MerR family transcriptional regulator [Deltaproteobacteria bacterium]|nr:MerR family transcriptional regulator [Deltaproteobacteria bacterium]